MRDAAMRKDTYRIGDGTFAFSPAVFDSLLGHGAKGAARMRELAGAVHVSISSIKDWRRGTHAPSDFEKVEDIACWAHIDVADPGDLEAPIPRHRRDLTIDETCSLRCDLLAEIFRDAGKKLASRIRYEILGRVGRRHGKAGLHGGGLAILRLGKDAKIKRRGGYTTKAMTATTHDFLPSDTLSQAQVSAKLSPREVQA